MKRPRGPLALTDGYRPRVLHAGSFASVGVRAGPSRPSHPTCTYLITCWCDPGMRIGPGTAMLEQPQEGIWLTPPGERVCFSAPKGNSVGWIHCRLVTSRAWRGKTGYDFHLTSPGNTQLIQPCPEEVWGVDLRHVPPANTMSWASRACFRIIETWSDPAPSAAIDADGELALLFHRWFREQLRYGLVDPSVATDVISLSDVSIIRRCNRLLGDHSRMDLTVDGVARHVGVKPDVLARVYLDLSGQSLGKLLRERRLRYARQLLRRTRLTVEEVARRCGYASAVVLRRAFKRRFRQRPGDCRR